ncbi:MAG TPA: cyclase family protein [Armatimonadetes bacterium]|nr:cyclase family protein [Armatimonadota bacterium]
MSKHRRLLDLSMSLRADLPQPDPPRFKYTPHRAGGTWLGLGAAACGVKGSNWWSIAKEVLSELLTGRLVRSRDFPDGCGLAWEDISCDTHAGTHLDAPWHFGPYCDGRPAKTVDLIPLEWCYSEGVVLDLRHKPPGSYITPEDLQEALRRINYTLKPLDIVLLMTGASAYHTEPRYLTDFPGVSREATLWLTGQGIKIIGIDAFCFDRPWPVMAAEYQRTGNPRVLWEAHLVGREVEYCHLENLANLDQIPQPYGFEVICFPIKIERGSAGWARVVAVLPEGEETDAH